MQHALVSVIIPTYRRTHLLQEALTSVLRQVYRNLEVVVVNDFPPARSRVDRLVRRFDDERIRVHHHERSRGGNAARNTGVREAAGSILAFLDDDDLWLPSKIEKHVAVHRARHAGVVYSGALRLDEGDDRPPWVEHVPLPDRPLREAMRRAEWAPSIMSSATVAARCFEASGLFDEDLQSFQDWDMWFRMSRHCTFDHIDEPLSVVRGHGGTRTSIDIDRRVRGLEQIIAKWGEEIDVERFRRIYLRSAYYHGGVDAACQRDWEAAWHAFQGLWNVAQFPQDVGLILKLFLAIVIGGKAFSALRTRREKMRGRRADERYHAAVREIRNANATAFAPGSPSSPDASSSS